MLPVKPKTEQQIKVIWLTRGKKEKKKKLPIPLQWSSCARMHASYVCVHVWCVCGKLTSSPRARSISTLLWIELWNLLWFMMCCSITLGSSPHGDVSITPYKKWTCSVFTKQQKQSTHPQLSVVTANGVFNYGWLDWSILKLLYSINIIVMDLYLMNVIEQM